jgi:hypothetical protein
MSPFLAEICGVLMKGANHTRTLQMGSFGDEFRLIFTPERGKKGVSSSVSDTPGGPKVGIWRFSGAEEE